MKTEARGGWEPNLNWSVETVVQRGTQIGVLVVRF